MKETGRMFLTVILVVGALAILLMLEERAGLLQAGDHAPDFSGVLSTGERISLNDFHDRRPVVLFFYPKDFSGGCTQQVCTFRDSFGRIRDLGAVVFGISEDDSSSHERFIQHYNLPFPLITDNHGSISRAYGVTRLGGLIPLVKRVTYVIDRQGIIRGVFSHEVLIGRHVEDVVRTLESLHSEKGSGEPEAVGTQGAKFSVRVGPY